MAKTLARLFVISIILILGCFMLFGGFSRMPNRSVVGKKENLENNDNPTTEQKEQPKATPQVNKLQVCRWSTITYEPSFWELEWSENIAVRKTQVCPLLQTVEESKRSETLLKKIQSFMSTKNKATNKLSYSYDPTTDNIFSRFWYKLECFKTSKPNLVLNENMINWDAEQVSTIQYGAQLIEPIIGMTRDPVTMCPRNPHIDPQINQDYVQSKRHLLFGPSAPWKLQDTVVDLSARAAQTGNVNDSPSDQWYQSTIAPWFHGPVEFYYDESMHEGNRNSTTVGISWFMNTPDLVFKLPRNYGKIILLDLGAAYFNRWDKAADATSTVFFYQQWKNKELLFDRLIAIEAAQLDPTRAWKDIPLDAMGSYTLINIPCSVEGKDNPWKMLKQIAKPSDYVIIKLDIDTPHIENPLFEQIVADKEIYSLVDEMAYEHHVDIPEMHIHWGRIPNLDLEDTYKAFLSLRQHNVRMHSWP